MEPQKEKEMNAIEQIKAELKGKQIIVISENDGIANIKWDCRSLDGVKALLASAQSFIADKQVEELRGIGSGPDYNTTEGRFRNAHKFQQEQPEVKLEKDKCLGCNNVKGCVTCVDGNQWAHISEVEGKGESGRGPHTESWIESVKKELQHEEELLDMRLDTLRRIREKKNQFQQGRPEEDFETEYAKFSNDPNALDYALPIDLADYKDFARHFYKLGLKARKED